jgi:hypothetical protein
MASAASIRAFARTTTRVQTRAFSSSRAVLDTVPVVTPAPALGTVPPPKRPVGGFRGGSV